MEGRSMSAVRTPSYRLHKPTGQAVATFDGRDVYFGKYGSIASKAAYDRTVAEWLANGRRFAPAADVAVNELMVQYLQHADGYYVKDGEPTSQATLIRNALRPLKRLYGDTPAASFGPRSLVAVRQAYVDAGLSRSVVNRYTGLVVQFFKWCTETELVPASVHHGLKAVACLRKGRSDVREAEGVRSVPDAYVDAIEPHVSRQVWAMCELMRLTGARPGEICIMRACDLDTAGRIWEYVPDRHKNEHHGKERRIYLGPKAQEIVKPWLCPELGAYLFSPAEAEAERLAEMRRRRKSPVQPSQLDRSKPGPGRKLGDRYNEPAFRLAVRRGCEKADVPAWAPNRLRHNAATMLRKQFGLDIARVILGHSNMVTTEVYAEVDREKAIRVMAEVG